MVRQPEISKVGMNTSSQMERQRIKIVQGPGSTHPGRAGGHLWSLTMPPTTFNLLTTLPFAESGQNPAENLGNMLTTFHKDPPLPRISIPQTQDHPIAITEGRRGRMENEPKSEMPKTDTGWQSKGSQLTGTQRFPLLGVGGRGGVWQATGELLSKSEEKETVPPDGTQTLSG